MPRDTLGAFEAEVLSLLVRHQGRAYGALLARDFDKVGRSVSLGAIYTTLERLQAKGLASSAWGEPSSERGGRRKRLFSITAPGHQAIERMAARAGAWQMFGGLAPEGC